MSQKTATVSSESHSMLAPPCSTFDLQDLIEAAGRLPVCDRAAKLHALIARLIHVTSTGGSIAPVANALAAAAVEALLDDPWVQFEMASRRFTAGHPIAPAPMIPELVHEGEGHGLLRIQSPLD
jgi:hypothetical protein